MIAQELIGCRVIETESGNRKVVGKIVGSNNQLVGDYSRSSGSALRLVILQPNGEIREEYLYKVMVHPDDLKKIYNVIKPRPIGSRSEILDIRTNE